MGFLKQLKRQKMGVHPRRINFEKENPENRHITWDDQMKPCIMRNDGITEEECRALMARWDEMLTQAEEILWIGYLDPSSDAFMSDVGSFPDIRYLTGNYYVEHVSYGYIYRDDEERAYRVKDGRLLCRWPSGDGWKERWLPLDSPQASKGFYIQLGLCLTGDRNGKEQDYLGLELNAELLSLEDAIEFDILSDGEK